MRKHASLPISPSYPLKFYGKVVVGSDGKKYWIGGENVQAVAYDLPIPGYKTKTTINLRLWSTKVPSQDFDLQAFNAGQHTKANEAQANAEKVCMLCNFSILKGKIYWLYVLFSSSIPVVPMHSLFDAYVDDT